MRKIIKKEHDPVEAKDNAAFVIHACANTGIRNYHKLTAALLESGNIIQSLRDENKRLLFACKTALEYRKQKYHGDDKCIVMLEKVIEQAESFNLKTTQL